MIPFSDRLFEAVREKESAVVVGIDPDPAKIPRELFPGHSGGSPRERVAAAIQSFATAILRAVADVAVAVKPQLAYFERFGPPGLAAYEATVREAQALGLLVIADGKRNDIGSTAEQYAAAYLGPARGERHGPAARDALFGEADDEGPKADALTVNPYLGSDGIRPFMDRLSRGKGIFLLAKTSNPSSSELQDLTPSGFEGRQAIYEAVGGWAERWSREAPGRSGYGAVGVVVGATHPEQLKALRAQLPHVPFLVPGFGAQGGTAADVSGAFDERGLGAVVNASRSILYAYLKEPGTPFDEAARVAAIRMRDALRRAAPVL